MFKQPPTTVDQQPAEGVDESATPTKREPLYKLRREPLYKLRQKLQDLDRMIEHPGMNRKWRHRLATPTKPEQLITPPRGKPRG